MKELNLSELTVKQKISMTLCGYIIFNRDEAKVEENLQYTIELIKDHSLGAVWVRPNVANREEVITRIKAAADYPILIFTDAESGFVDNLIGRHNAISMTGSEELAYIFGKVTGTKARKAGYNVVCNPILDLNLGNSVCNMTMRSYGADKETVTRLAAAEARGMHDAGVLTVGKHYPGGTTDLEMDSHMAEAISGETEEELVQRNIYPYVQLSKMGLLDGMMTAHCRFPNIDPDYPASLSEKVIGIVRDQGFDGFAITDALAMMGIVAKFGSKDSKGLSIQNGNDLALCWVDNKTAFEAMVECYEKGILTEDRLDIAAARVLQTQHKTTLFRACQELTEEELALYDKINTDGIYATADDGLHYAIDPKGKHFIALQVPVGSADSHGKITVDTFTNQWYQPNKIRNMLEEKFPNSRVFAMDEFPSTSHNWILLHESIDYDDVVLITFIDGKAYQGDENFTGRFLTAVKALQRTNRVSAIVHYGNPFPLESLEHIPRVIVGSTSEKAVETGIRVLAGEYPAKGVLAYDIHLK